MPNFNGLSSSILGNLQNSAKLLLCTLDLIEASPETRSFAAHGFANQLLVEMRSQGGDPTCEKVRDYIRAGVHMFNDTFETWKPFSPALQQECETALVNSLGRFELYFFESENKESITTASLIHELAVLKTLFPNTDERSLKLNLLTSTLCTPETYCEFERLSSDRNNQFDEIFRAFNENTCVSTPQNTDEIDEWLESLQ